MKVTHKLRLSEHDAHYGGHLVDGARVLGLFGDVATEILIRHDGDEGLFRAYEKVDFLAPLYAGDFIEVEAELISVGKSSRKMHFKCFKIITARPDISASAADLLAEKILVTEAIGTCVVLVDKMRGHHE
ncbi:MAG: 3-aminobutyryl-CoA ammonia lyase [Tenericutes bacterium GWC2_34_14]|nr:MAG: 3-aminobutyryl-CoA ammonia lyase [Tenericutes bacterium GWA2_35_7]OHE30095.1 MAG: 3-aminobutyryl-CoA ammonia lyase [Tenericutes bacterium GWC2_34_14]OHE35075.1 MAG: 3-aminobutyryl-CoA ammonia lyase [Tenericutes bacterium GWE2_34_108]OHE37467.1 MAG: 3-aminobutyryl-CoA ammonia lyase [Tenericutes bacterium GWF1_35_14]OHE39801.1 MAG: 3-aminobutyryl-CoA ammonia lyase [Tenericutes bacterium GWF2_35_184]OHE44013.1 MAG: 3-aminobutyryl-CoA ammonia lyase [Tenericutes bacterium RIFOXYA12_FULL_35_